MKMPKRYINRFAKALRAERKAGRHCGFGHIRVRPGIHLQSDEWTNYDSHETTVLGFSLVKIPTGSKTLLTPEKEYLSYHEFKTPVVL